MWVPHLRQRSLPRVREDYLFFGDDQLSAKLPSGHGLLNGNCDSHRGADHGVVAHADQPHHFNVGGY